MVTAFAILAMFGILIGNVVFSTSAPLYDITGDYLMTQGAHAPKAMHEFVGSHYPKDCRVAKHCLSVNTSAVSALIGWLAPGARLPSGELPILENKRPPKLA